MTKKTFTCGDVIRFRAGGSALMKVEKTDTLCGYRTYHGMHLFGERISIAHNDKCELAVGADMKQWRSHSGIRAEAYKLYGERAA